MKSKNAKKQGDIMHVIERRRRFGGLSFELRCSGKSPSCSGKDPVTRGENKVYVKTYRVPDGLTKKQIAEFRLQVQIEWKKHVESLSNGTTYQPTKILFRDFANEFTENIIKQNSEAYNYYKKVKDAVVVLNERLGNYYLHELNQKMIDDFVIWLGQRKFTKTTVTVKKSLRELVYQQGKKLVQVARSCKLSDTALLMAVTVGKQISIKTAQVICDYLGVSTNDYFDIKVEEIQYAKSVNQSTKTVLQSILKKAVKYNYIPRNYASNDYSDNVSGRISPKRAIYDTKEDILAFDKCIGREQNPEVKLTCALYLYLGVRGAEASAIQWNDISFKTPQDSELHICRNSVYVSGFGIRTKDVKTKNAERTIVLPEKMYYILMEYKIWWDTQKEKHGDLWANTDRLFVTNKGKNRSAMTLREWVNNFEKKNNLKHVSPHKLRATNITLMGLINISPKAAQIRAGHANYSTTVNIYDRGTKTANQEAANLINDFFNIQEETTSVYVE